MKENTVFLEIPFDMAWEAAFYAIIEKLQMPTEVIKRDSGLIATQYMAYATSSMDTEEALEKIAERPGGWFNLWSSCRIKIDVFLTTVSSSRTAIEIKANIEVSERRSGQWQTCRSKGVVEEKVLDAIKSTLE
jgi:hypothetical protein